MQMFVQKILNSCSVFTETQSSWSMITQKKKNFSEICTACFSNTLFIIFFVFCSPHRYSNYFCLTVEIQNVHLFNWKMSKYLNKIKGIWKDTVWLMALWIQNCLIFIKFQKMLTWWLRWYTVYVCVYVEYFHHIGSNVSPPIWKEYSLFDETSSCNKR